MANLVRGSERGHEVSKAERQRLRREADASRERIVSTVGEFSDVARETKDEAIATAKKYAPIAAGAVAGLALLVVASGGRKRRY